MATRFDFLMVGGAGLLLVGGYWSGKNRLLSFIVGNYIFLVAGLGLRYALEYLGQWLVAFGDQILGLGFRFAAIGNLLINASVTIVFIVYLIFLLKIYKEVPLRMSPFSRDRLDQFSLMVLVILGIGSFVFTIAVLAFGISFFDPFVLERMIGPLTDHLGIYYFRVFSPVWIFVHGVITFFLLFSARPSVPSFSLPDEDQEPTMQDHGLVG